MFQLLRKTPSSASAGRRYELAAGAPSVATLSRVILSRAGSTPNP